MKTTISDAARVEMELKAVRKFGMTPVGSVGTRVYRDPDTGTLNVFNVAENVLQEMNNEPEAYLSFVWQSWLKAQGIPLVSAEELQWTDAGKDLTPEQLQWIASFVHLWDLTQGACAGIVPGI